MKNAQAILQFSGYPLEPIVAREVQKSYSQKLRIASRNLSSSTQIKEVKPNCPACIQGDWSVEWYNNYE